MPPLRMRLPHRIRGKADSMTDTEKRNAWWLRADIHTYAIPLTPKTLLETLRVAEHALQSLERERPGLNAGGSIASHRERIRLLMDECERKRPTRSDGKHGNLHTTECGCEDRQL